MSEKRYLTVPKLASAILDYYHYENIETTRNALVKKIKKVCKNMQVKANGKCVDFWESLAELNGEKKAQASRLFTDTEFDMLKDCDEIFNYFLNKYNAMKDIYLTIDVSKLNNENQLAEYNFVTYFSQNIQARIQAEQIFDRDEYARGQYFAESNYTNAPNDREPHISSIELEKHRCTKMLEALYNLYFEPVDIVALENDLNTTLIDPDYDPQLLQERMNAENRLANPENYCKRKDNISAKND